MCEQKAKRPYRVPVKCATFFTIDLRHMYPLKPQTLCILMIYKAFTTPGTMTETCTFGTENALIEDA
jgi:hypothetical protein